MNKKILVIILFGIFFSSFAFAQTFSGPQGGEFSGGYGGSYVVSNPSYFPSGFQGDGGYNSYYGIDFNEYQEVCRERQDFIIQIAPGGCTPAVVRSDLLAEQNVPVFCKLQAMQINPAVQAEYIKNIAFTSRGSLAKEVAAVSYYRPKVALSPRINTNGFPTIDNIGYMVIVLRRQPNENNLTEFVSGNLTARLTYDVPNGFGNGQSDLIIPALDQDTWNSEYTKYSFFDGRGFVRVESVSGDSAVVEVYSSKDQVVQRVNLEKGKSSGEIYLPGSYCSAAYKLTLVDTKPADVSARIVVDGEDFDVYGGEKFANGLCVVRSIKSDSSDLGVGSVSLSCNGKTFNLELGYKKTNFEVNGVSGSYNVGDKIYELDDNGIKRDIYFAAVTHDSIGNQVSVLLLTNKTFDVTLKSSLNNYLNNLAESFDGGEILTLSNGQEGGFRGEKIKFSDLIEREDTNSGNSAFENSFESAIDSYKKVDDDYNAVQFNSKLIGRDSLFRGIDLADDKNKEKTSIELNERVAKYSFGSSGELNLVDDSFNFDRSKSNYVLDTGNLVSVISLKEIRKPSLSEKSVSLLVNNAVVSVSNNGDFISVKDEKGGYIQLKSFDDNSIFVDAKCINGDGSTSSVSGDAGRIDLGSEKVVCDKNILVSQINLVRNAKVRLEPINRNAGSEINVSYSIGIEKRAIQLSPEKTKNRITRLNQSIAQWEKISTNLGQVVKGMKAACFATGAALQVKNLFGNLGGKAIARSEVMTGMGGWNELCGSAISNGGVPVEGKGMAPGPYNSLDDCYTKNSDNIEKDVNEFSKHIDSVNNEIKQIETPYTTKQSSLLGGSGINYDGAKTAYFNNVKKELTGKNIKVNNGKPSSSNEYEEISVSDVFDSNLGNGSVSYEQLREIKLYSSIYSDSSSSERAKSIANTKLFDTLNSVNKLKEYDEAKSLTAEAGKNIGAVGQLGFSGPDLSKGQNTLYYYGAKADLNGDNNLENAHVVIDKTSGKKYYVELKDTGSEGKFIIDKVYEFNSDSSVGDLVNDGEEAGRVLKTGLMNQYSYFVKRDAGAYKNTYQNYEVRFYETDPYKGMPAVVPIDVKDGWYAATKQTLPTFGNVKAFEDSGRVSSFWLCNVGSNGREEFSGGLGDDECQQFNLNTGQALDIFPGLSESKARDLVSRSINALEKVASQYKTGIQRVNVPGIGSVKVGNPAANSPETQCQNFMSPRDCQVLFNVCDPVICPSSRCNLGGKYYANDVVQTGIVGSIAMCLPNYKEGILIPVCLTGVHAGVDNYVSILEASRDCLQENLNTGAYVGICDEITAIYTCEFFWRQVSPAVNVIIPKLLEAATGRGTRGGGEYLSVQSAWENTQNSIDYFKNVYGVNAIKAFRARSTAEVGTNICKQFVSTKYPNKFKTLIEPDSPSQFSAWFTEIKQSDAVVPAISQYKVYYHIFAGNDIGVQYNIYLRNSPGESFFQGTGIVQVATGFIGRGEYADEARDFTAPSGFKELCVRINAEEKCGFQQVSTSFAVNYIRDKYVENQITDNTITSEKACISGTPDPLALLNPNPQAGVEEATIPSIYNRGIIRICSTSNPGTSTDASRWQRVGYCDDTKIGCWLDRDSVGQAISPENQGIQNKTISELDAIRESLEDEGKRFVDDVSIAPELLSIETQINDLEWKAISFTGEEEENFDDSSKEVNGLLDSLEKKYVLTSDQTGILLYLKARVYGAIAENAWANLQIEKGKDREDAATIPSVDEKPVDEKPVEGEEKPTTPQLNTRNDRILFACTLLTDLGYNEIHTSGIIGNLLQESNLDTTILGDSGSAYGLAQWRLDRRTNLENFAKSLGKDASDFETQIKFIDHELKGSGGNGGGSEIITYNNLVKTTTTSSAARVFMELYERPKDKQESSRIKYANEVHGICFTD